MRSRILTRVGLVGAAIVAALLLVPNARSLYEGIYFYVPDTISHPDLSSYRAGGDARPVNRTGRYASLYDLVGLRNVERYDYLIRQLEPTGATVARVPIPASTFPSLFVRFSPTGPYTIFSAHYDKLHDDTNYQGASDNTAAVSVLLASAKELASRGYQGSAALLFTGEEERGLRGSAAFIPYARSSGISIRENVNFDNIGRGRLAIRPSVQVPGYVFTLPFYGDLTYDGRTLSRSGPYQLANERLTKALLQLQPDMVVYQRFTALSDSNVFQADGIDTVAISGDDMHFLELTWHTYDDRVELLDEQNLDRAFDLVTAYAQP